MPQIPIQPLGATLRTLFTRQPHGPSMTSWNTEGLVPGEQAKMQLGKTFRLQRHLSMPKRPVSWAK